MTAQHRLLLSARCLTAGGAFLAAAAAFHFFAAHHIAPILRRAVDAKTFTFLEPIVFVHISVERRPAPAPLVHREKSDKCRSVHSAPALHPQEPTKVSHGPLGGAGRALRRQRSSHVLARFVTSSNPPCAHGGAHPDCVPGIR